MKEIALIGPTASGKSSLAIELAEEFNAFILSLDSLSVYKEVNIASAKPSLEDRKRVVHFGIDEVRPDEHFNVSLFFKLYENAKERSKKEGKNLIIVGGTSFYLKAMIEGLSPVLSVSSENFRKIKEILRNPQKAFSFIEEKDPEFARRITKRDVYRMGRWYEIYFESGLIATRYFSLYEKKPVVKSIPIFCIDMNREVLRDRIKKRTAVMIKEGIVDETFNIERKYSRIVKPLKAIGPKECLEYLDGKLTLRELEEKIFFNTAKLAKRQITFNKTQFKKVVYADLKKIREDVKKIFN